ncbi:nucleophile aminohydrolase [Chytridium lagenaria]|nr:nucleophile aminohydrolase [Chytridium lagenaria]
MELGALYTFVNAGADLATLAFWGQGLLVSFKCGIIGLLLSDPNSAASAELYEGLGILQHRGQDAAGIVTCGQKGRLYQCKANGMVRDVFHKSKLASLIGYMGVGHVRYPTAGSSSNSEAQPFYVNSPYGIVVAHNGNLTNTKELRDFLDTEAHRHVNTDSDSELLLNIFANNLQKTGKFRINEEDIFTALKGVYRPDPNGIRPLIYGERKSPNGGTDYMIASESVVLDALGFTNFVDVKPGEAVIFRREGLSKRQCILRGSLPLAFSNTFVNFARPDSVIDGVSVYKARLAMGEALATQVQRRLGTDLDIDVVIPISCTSSVLQAEHLYREGFIKNRYVGRTFIMPGQSLRKKSVRRKLNPMPMEFADKNVLIIDDSIVRGTTSREIVQMARDSGAKKVYFASCSPAIRFPNVYGIDMPTRQELIAFNRSDDDVAHEIGADFVIFQDLNDLVQSVSKFNANIKAFDVSVFNGCYVTGDITLDYLKELEDSRNSNVTRQNSLANLDVIGLHNQHAYK